LIAVAVEVAKVVLVIVSEVVDVVNEVTMLVVELTLFIVEVTVTVGVVAMHEHPVETIALAIFFKTIINCELSNVRTGRNANSSFNSIAVIVLNISTSVVIWFKGCSRSGSTCSCSNSIHISRVIMGKTRFELPHW
jgi:hypothetical protein